MAGRTPAAARRVWRRSALETVILPTPPAAAAPLAIPPLQPSSQAQGDSSPAGPAVGTMLVVGLVLLAAGLGAFAVWFQWDQTRRSLAFFGAEAARQIQSAPRVELWSLEARDGEVRAVERRDVSRAPGLVHLRRGLVEDVNYRWGVAHAGQGQAAATDVEKAWSATGPAGRLPAGSWDTAIAFGDGSGGRPLTVLAFDLDGAGSMTVVGRPGRLALGRIGPGLREWIETTEAIFSR